MPRGVSRYDEAARQGRLWTPAVWAGTAKLSLWLDATKGPFTFATGISQWSDISGNANHATQATSTKQPAYSGTGWTAPNATMPAVSFDLVNDAMDLTSAITYSGGSGMSFRAATLQTTTATTISAAGGATGAPVVRKTTGNFLALIRNVTTIQTGTITVPTTASLIGVDAATNLSRLWVNGQSEQQTGTDPAFTQGLSSIGYNSATGNVWGGKFGEVIYSNAILASNEAALIDGYLAWRWGTVGNLYPQHAFKNRPPLIGD